MEEISTSELRTGSAGQTIPVSELAESISALINEIRSLKELIQEDINSREDKCDCIMNPDSSFSPWLFVPIIQLAKDGSISAKIASSLDVAGIKYVSDFQYVTLNELSKIRTFKDNEFSDLLQLLDERFNVQISNSRTICPMFTVGDLVRFIPDGSMSIPHDETLRILSIDHSPLLPKYTCSVMDGSRKFVLSPSVLTSWNR